MTSRELLLRTFQQKPCYRVPISPFIHHNCVKEFKKDAQTDIILGTMEMYSYFGFDAIHRNCTPTYNDISDIQSDNWVPKKKITTNNRDQTIHTTIETPEGRLTETYAVSWVTEYDAEASPVEFIIKSRNDFELFAKYQPPVGTIDTKPIQRTKALLKDQGITAPWIQGAFNHVAIYFRKLDDLLLDAMTNPDFYHAIMHYFQARNKSIISQYIEAGTDAFSYAGNIASGKMVGANFYRKFILPYEKELIAFIQGKGCYVQYHNCGYAKNLLSCYKDLSMDVYESLTPPPFGDTVLEEALAIFPNTITLSGNIDQIEFLKTASPKEIKERVAQVLHQAKQRGNFILSTTDYFMEETPYENIQALADAGREHGLY